MLKKFTFIMVLFALALGVLVVPATATYAAESPSTEYYNAQYDYSYEETVMPTNQIVRKYEKPTASVFSRSAETNSTEKTKAILASLGMGEDFIDALSTEQLNDYANSKSIMATTSFIKTDAEGNSTYVTEGEAQSGARGFVPPGTSEDDLNDPGDYPDWSSQSADNYMRIFLLVLHYGGSLYKYSADAEWITEPESFPNGVRWIDLFSIGTDMNTVIPETRYGWFKYTVGNCEEGVITSNEFEEEFFEGDDVILKNDGSAQACAIKFLLPNDSIEIVGWETPTIYEWRYVTYNYDFKMHLEFKSNIKQPNLVTVFNVAASYSHSNYEMVFDVNASVGFGLGGGLYLNPQFLPDDRYTMLPTPIVYTPA